MKGLLLMTDNSCNKFRYGILNDNTFFLKKKILLKTIMAVTGLAYIVQFGVELKYLMLIRLHSDLFVRTVHLHMSLFQ